jgi:DNA-binding transcriptional ArsR family regulator
MTEGPYIAEAASLIGDPARANMLAALLGGRAMTATELGITAGVAPSTASGHLAKLLDGKLVSVVPAGRHRYFRLASPAVARVLEELMVLAGDGPPRHRPRSRCEDAMARARTCYDHLAGKLGVALADSLAAEDYIVLTEEGGLLTDSGRAFLGGIGVELDREKSRRAFCRPCLDWSERRWHIGGAVGAALADRCFALGWTERREDSRAIRISAAGERAFGEMFGVRL